jgi:hypothetical protein
MRTNQHFQSVPLTAQVLRPAAKYYYQCTEETQRAIKNLSLVLLFTIIVCGAIFAASICKFCFGSNYHLFIPVFAITAFFYYLIDKPIIFNAVKPNQKLIKWIRIFIAFILGLFNSFLIDTFYFKDDIAAARNIEISKSASAIRTDFEEKNSSINSQKTNFMQLIGKENSILSSKRDALNAEADGSGGSRHAGMKDIWRSKYAMYQSDSIDAAKKIIIYQEEISKLNTLLDVNTSLMNAQIADLPNQTSTGINKSMELLHKVIWLEGNFTNILMSILILIISMLFELAPLISKSFYDTSEYFDKCANQKDVKEKEAILIKNKELNLVGLRVMLEQKREENNLIRENVEIGLTESIEHSINILGIAKLERNRLEVEDNKLRKRYPQDFDTYFRPVLETSYSNIHHAVMAAISKN